MFSETSLGQPGLMAGGARFTVEVLTSNRLLISSPPPTPAAAAATAVPPARPRIYAG